MNKIEVGFSEEDNILSFRLPRENFPDTEKYAPQLTGGRDSDLLYCMNWVNGVETLEVEDGLVRVYVGKLFGLRTTLRNIQSRLGVCRDYEFDLLSVPETVYGQEFEVRIEGLQINAWSKHKVAVTERSFEQGFSCSSLFGPFSGPWGSDMIAEELLCYCIERIEMTPYWLRAYITEGAPQNEIEAAKRGVERVLERLCK